MKETLLYLKKSIFEDFLLKYYKKLLLLKFFKFNRFSVNYIVNTYIHKVVSHIFFLILCKNYAIKNTIFNQLLMSILDFKFFNLT